MYSGKIVVFVQNGCIRAKVVVIGQNLFSSDKVFVFEEKLLYSDKVFVIGYKLLFVFVQNSIRENGCIRQSLCIPAKVVVFG